MEITVKLFSNLRNGRFDSEIREYASGATVSQIIGELNIPEKKVSIIFVNGRHADLNHELYNKDVVAFFPPIGGG